MKTIPVCSECRSPDVWADASASWSFEDQRWELETTFQNTYCTECDGETHLDWIEEEAA